MRVPASGPRDAKLMVVGMAPAKEEVATGRPFAGPSGRELDEALAYSHLPRSQVFVTNVLDFPIPLKTSIFGVAKDELAKQTQRLWREIEEVKPNVILTLGADPLKVLSNEEGIQKWRGSIIPSRRGQKMVVGMHPAAFLYGGWKWKGVFKYIDVPRAVEEMESPDIVLPKRDSITGPSFGMVRDYIRWAEQQDILSFDIETTKDYADIGCVGIGCRPDEAMCIPFVRGGYQPYWSEEQEHVIWRDLARLLQSNVPKVAQNASFEWLHFWQYGIFPKNLWMDTMTAHHCLYPDFGATEDIFGKKKGDSNNPGHALAFINSQYTRTPFYKDEGRYWRPEYGDHAFWRYNCLDVMVTLEAALKMMEELKRKGLIEIHRRAYLRPFLHTVRMEWKGVKQDLELRDRVKEELSQRVGLLKEYMKEDIGYELNVKSPKQMAKFLYEDRGYAKRYKQVKTAAGIKSQVTTDKSVIEYYMRRGDKTLEAVQHLQQLRDLIGDILDQPLGPTGALHTHYKIGGTNGLRWSSAKGILGIGTNLQNIPRDGVPRRLFLPS